MSALVPERLTHPYGGRCADTEQPIEPGLRPTLLRLWVRTELAPQRHEQRDVHMGIITCLAATGRGARW